MALTSNIQIFPGFMPGRGGAGMGSITPFYPVRGPGWSIKQKARWSNVRQETTSGKTLVVKYWTNPLWSWDWVYDVILDNPNTQNPYYNGPIPYTDFQILEGFWNAMQAGGNIWAFQPPDSQIGTTSGMLTVTGFSGAANLWTIYISNNTIYPGQTALFTGFGTATWLNGQYLQILNATSTYIQVFLVHAGTFGVTADAGQIFAGMQLLSPDQGNNSEITHIIGGYPTIPIAGTPTVTNQVLESVQLIDASTLQVFENGSILSPASYTVQAANTVGGYQGLVLNFGGGVISPPLLAAFNYYYVCRFADDELEWENFMSMLWSTSSFKFEQVRL